MKTLVVIESWFGNTYRIGEAIAAGIASVDSDVRTVKVDDAPAEVGGDVGLLIVGAPTHNRGLSTPATRSRAADAVGVVPGSAGIKEWLETAVIPDSVAVAAFDTSTAGGWLSGSAAKAAARILKRRSAPILTRSFTVGGVEGPLKDGEIEQAREWGRSLVSGE